MKIKIIGGGWYGCHLAMSLRHDHDVLLYEGGKELFGGASGSNQSRLHLGFHYPRCSYTRSESIEGFQRFMEVYGFVTEMIPTNIYAVSEGTSLIDYVTYRDIMSAQGLSFLEIEAPEEYGLSNIEGAMLTAERLIVQEKAKKYFNDKLEDITVFNKRVTTVSDSNYDVVIDCTFGSFNIHEVQHFEPCVMQLYLGDDSKAITVMDGPRGASIYPFGVGEVSLTTVEHTPLAQDATMQDARETVQRFNANLDWQHEVQHAMEDRIKEYYPDFKLHYRKHGHMAAVRVKPKSGTDRRSVLITDKGNNITVFPGKICGVFEAEDEIRGLLGC